MKSILRILLIILISSSDVLAQENLFLSRDYWKRNQSIENIKKDISEGNNPSELNRYAFDGVVYAILENANDDVIKYLLTIEGNSIEKKTHDSRTYIFWASYKGNINIMKHLLEKGAETDLRDSHGNTPVTFAATTGQKNIEVYELFEKNGVILKQEKNKTGINTLLLVAPYLKTEKELNYFISKGFNIRGKDPKGNNIFNYAVKKGNIPFLKLLIKKGINPRILNKEGGNAMLYASKGLRNFKNPIKTYKFLKNLGIAVNVVGDNGQNPLHNIAKRNNNLEIFSFFIKKGVDVNLQDNNGISPFMNSVISNNLDSVKFLSEYVEDFDLKNKKGLSALSIATNKSSVEVVDFLLKKGANINIKDNNYNSIAYYLIESFKPENLHDFNKKLSLLKNNGLTFNQVKNEGNTLLHIAIKKNNLQLLKSLTPFKIDINAKNNLGYTSLHLAAMMSENDSIIKYLLNLGANKNIKTKFGETVFELASENELLKKVKLNFLR